MALRRHRRDPLRWSRRQRGYATCLFIEDRALFGRGEANVVLLQVR
jgi:hypothetical protein